MGSHPSARTLAEHDLLGRILETLRDVRDEWDETFGVDENTDDQEGSPVAHWYIEFGKHLDDERALPAEAPTA